MNIAKRICTVLVALSLIGWVAMLYLSRNYAYSEFINSIKHICSAIFIISILALRISFLALRIIKSKIERENLFNKYHNKDIDMIK